MARRLQLTPDVIAQIQRRRAQGADYVTLAREFGVSQGSIGTALKATPTKPAARKRRPPAPVETTPAKRASKARRPPPPPESDPGDDDGDTDDVNPIVLLRRQVTALERLAKEAHDGDSTPCKECGRGMPNIAAFATLSRVINTSLALMGKLTPPPPLDPEASPDMQAAAAAARAKLADLVGKARAEVTL